MAILNIYEYYNKHNSFIEDNQGNTKPNVIDNNSIAYYVFEDATVDGVLPTGTTDDAMIDLAHSLLHAGETTLAQTMIDYFIANGFEFTRSSIVPGPTVYTTGESPYIMLKYIECLEKLYEITGTTSYQTAATTVATRLNTNMTITGADYPYAGSSRAVLLYDGAGALVTSYRSGIYVSDINPLAWLLKGYTTNVSAAVSCVRDSQKLFERNFDIDGLFMPFYSENLTENASYTPIQNWLFDGPLNNEADMIHSYRTALNIARYYYTRKKEYDGTADAIAKVILDKFLTYMSDYYIANGVIPTTLTAGSVLDFSDNVTTFDEDITFDQIYKSMTVTSDRTDIGFIAMLGLTALLKFKADRDEYCFNLANSMIQELYALQQTDGSILGATYTYISHQAFVQEFFYRYININNKTYLELINEALDILNKENIYTSNLTTHSYSIATQFCQDGLARITREKFWEWAYTETELTYNAGVNEYNLSTYEVNAHRIENIDFFYQNKYYKLDRIDPQTYLEYITRYSTTGRPVYFTTKGETLYLWQKPDQDYTVKVNHYKEQFSISNYNAYPDLLPPEWSFLLKWYIVLKIALMNNNILSKFFEFIYLLTFNLMATADESDTSARKQIPSAFDWQEVS